MSDPVSRTILAYDRIARAYGATWFDDPVMEPMLDRFLSLVGAPGGVLDAGCGAGRDVLAMAKRGMEAVGIDLSTAMIEEAKERVPDRVFRRMDMRSLKYPPETFAGVWACASIHHLPLLHAARSLREFERVLKPGGILSLSVEEGQGEYFDSMGRFRRFYTTTEICKLVKEAGFQIIEVRSSLSDKATSGEGCPKKWLLILAKKSNASSVFTDSETTHDCVFCSASRFQSRSEIGIPGSGSILWGDQNLYVISDIAPLVEGHLLIVTTRHYVCVGACPEKLIRAVHSAQEQIRGLFQDAYCESAVFLEHGPARRKQAGACIDHAHLHCLPMSFRVKDAVEKLLGPGQATSADTLRQLYLAGQSYLNIENGEEDACVIPVDVIPSQFFRQVVTSLLGCGTWRWQMSCRLAETKERHRLALKKLLPLADALWGHVIEDK